jgi:hypothetical protein
MGIQTSLLQNISFTFVVKFSYGLSIAGGNEMYGMLGKK